jgi:hypothetical protein
VEEKDLTARLDTGEVRQTYELLDLPRMVLENVGYKR